MSCLYKQREDNNTGKVNLMDLWVVIWMNRACLKWKLCWVRDGCTLM